MITEQETEKEATPESTVVILKKPLATYDTTEAKLTEIKTKYLALKINGIDDKEGYEIVKTSLREVVSLRKRVDERRTSLKRAIDNGSKIILESIAPVEAHLRSQKEAVDQEIANIKLKAEMAEQERFVARTQSLFDLGYSFNGSLYVLDTDVLTPTEIKQAPDEAWTQILENKTEFANVIKAKKQAEADEIARLKAENERLQAEARARAAAENTIADLKESGAITSGQVNSVEVTEEGTNINVAIHPVEPAKEINVNVGFEESVKATDAIGPQGDKQSGTRPKPSAEFVAGFNEARARFLEIIIQPKLTRTILKDAIINMTV